MALDEKFAEAFVNLDSHRVLGYKLQPFSIWHRFLLEFFNSPLITETASTNGVEDVLKAIQVCRVSYPNYPKKQGILSKIAILCRSWDVETQANRFMSYIEDYAAFPELWDKEDSDGKPSSAPETLSMAVQLIELGFSEKEAWDMPIGKAFWYSSISALLKGAEIDFVTAEERQMQENKDQILKDMAEAEKAMKAKMAGQANGV